MTGKELGTRLDERVFGDGEPGELLLWHQTRAGEEAAIILNLIQNDRFACKTNFKHHVL